jgi:hypothetical protein
MEPGLIAELSKFGPLALLAGMALFMWRDEIKSMAGAGRRDSAVEGVMAQMVALFEKNLVHFEALSRQAEKWVEKQDATVDEVKAMHETQRQILTELARSNARGGR